MFDLAPLYRSSIGFDHLARLLDEATSFELPAFPPYDIERLGEDEYRISLAIAGFGAKDVNIEVKGQDLTITGEKTDKPAVQTEYLHQAIASRSFERSFQLAEHVEVIAADLKNGLLQVSLKRVVPDALKPRTIAIGMGDEQASIAGKKAA
jgi:molecular chaperone IbpA